MNLEGRFHQEMLRIYEEAKEFDYSPTYFLRMVVDRGGLSAGQAVARRQRAIGWIRAVVA